MLGNMKKEDDTFVRMRQEDHSFFLKSAYFIGTHCQAALTLSQELGIPLVKDCEEFLAKIQEDLDPPQSPLQRGKKKN